MSFDWWLLPLSRKFRARSAWEILDLLGDGRGCGRRARGDECRGCAAGHEAGGEGYPDAVAAHEVAGRRGAPPKESLGGAGFWGLPELEQSSYLRERLPSRGERQIIL